MGSTNHNKALELILIEEFLKEQESKEIEYLESYIMIYNMYDELIYKGDPMSSESAKFKHSAEFIMEYGGIAYYLFLCR